MIKRFKTIKRSEEKEDFPRGMPRQNQQSNNSRNPLDIEVSDSRSKTLPPLPTSPTSPEPPKSLANALITSTLRRKGTIKTVGRNETVSNLRNAMIIDKQKISPSTILLEDITAKQKEGSNPSSESTLTRPTLKRSSTEITMRSHNDLRKMDERQEYTAKRAVLQTETSIEDFLKKPPKKIIKAIAAYLHKQTGEISFLKGDYFYVVNELADKYEVVNPLTKVHGVVPSDYFETVDNRAILSGRLNNGSNHSLTSPSKAFANNFNDSHRTVVPVSNDVCFVSVEKVDYINARWVFTLFVQHRDNSSFILFRSLSDLWKVHISMLTQFTEEAGFGRSPRIIPFLESPNRPIPAEKINERKQNLNAYLKELLKVPQYIFMQPYIKSIFVMRAGDIPAPRNAQFDASEVLLDMMESSEMQDFISIRLHLQADVIGWKAPLNVTLNEALDRARSRVRNQIDKLYYKSETNAILPLKEDSELNLMIRTLGKTIHLYLDECRFQTA